MQLVFSLAVWAPLPFVSKRHVNS
uniref:Uncharacterized protein n=1 Tax=Anguilla anguilla TaxID=7936 RepID=A0A0E9UFY6_ANGAN